MARTSGPTGDPSAAAGAPRTRARFPDAAPKAGHYESFYLKACHPTEPLGVWIRHTVHKRPGGQAVGSLWFVLFDLATGAPVASKVTLAPGELGTGPDHYLHIGESRLAPGRAVGAARSERCDAAWDLTFEGDEPPFPYLARPFLYRAPIPRTKAQSLYPAIRVSGEVVVDGRRVALDAWPGMIGHNWGSQHAERWIWAQGAAFRERPDAWLDVTVGRVKVGRWTLPWIANGCLALDGERHRLGGPERLRATKVSETPERCELVLPGDGITVTARWRSPREQIVCWVYADPDGPEHHTANCSVADLDVEVARPGQPPLTLTCPGGAAYELGMRERDHGLVVQPFSDP